MTRTTLTLDDELMALLKRFQQRRGYSFDEALRRVLREGLQHLQDPSLKESGPQVPYRTPTVSLGKPKFAHLDNITEVLAVAEGEGFR